jgi:hypothetical protein
VLTIDNQAITTAKINDALVIDCGVIASSFSPSAVLLTSGTSYTVPPGATSMKAWAVGSGGNYERGAGGTAYKTWPVTGGSVVSYSVGAAAAGAGFNTLGNNTTITYGGITITGCGGGRTISGSQFAGGDGGANGGGNTYWGGGEWAAGAVGGNTRQSASPTGSTAYKATDVAGLFAVLSTLGINPANTGGSFNQTPNVFGAGTFFDKYGNFASGGIGGGNGYNTNETRETGAAILYFT